MYVCVCVLCLYVVCVLGGGAGGVYTCMCAYIYTASGSIYTGVIMYTGVTSYIPACMIIYTTYTYRRHRWTRKQTLVYSACDFAHRPRQSGPSAQRAGAAEA
jgi:hypothetical protein